jgi:hypothetical protein
MRNLPSALMILAEVYIIIFCDKQWMQLIALALLMSGAFAFWEYPAKEGVELVRAQIEESKARTENIRWQTKLSETQVNVNLRTLALMKGR